MMTRTTELNSPEKMTRMNKYDTNLLRIFTINHRLRKEEEIAEAQWKENSWMKIESLRKRVGGQEK